MTDRRIELDRDRIARDFAERFEGKLPQGTIDSVSAHLGGTLEAAAAGTAHSATGSVASLVLWTKCKCAIKGGKAFDGSAWGVSFPGGGALFGDVYTDDLDALYAKTSSFVLIAAYAYTTFIFLDHHGHALGSFQAGSVSTVGGEGGGRGHWK